MAFDAPVPAGTPPFGEPLGEWQLAPESQSARTARRLVDQQLQGVDDAVRRRAALVTSELVGNGVRHADGGITLTLARLHHGWMVAVADASSAPPLVREVGPLAEEGRGLLIVDRVSDTYGWTPTATGKVVWAVLHDAVA